MPLPELFISALIVLCVIAMLAQRTRVSYPIAFLLGGIILGCIPQTPDIRIPQEYILVAFLPPLLMDAAFFTSLRDFMRNIRPILQLSIGLVVITTVAIAALFGTIISPGAWIGGFILGAIISPPDAVAATSIIKNLRVPKRIVTVLEGESLLNDATGLVLYKVAVGAMLYGSFSFISAGTNFLWMAVAGTIIGLALGFFFVMLYPRLKEPSVEILSTFILPYAAYVGAEFIHASGVLAVVAAGLVLGWYAPTLFSVQSRVSMGVVWKIVIFLLNALVFLMIGLTVPEVIEDLSPRYAALTLFAYAAMVCGVTVLVRLLYVYGSVYGLWYIFGRKKEPRPSYQNVFVIAWTGMRGVVSLATALALPVFLVDESPFPDRSLIIFLAFSVIVFTLVIQGLSLPYLLKLIPLSFNPDIIREDWEARVNTTRRALEHVEMMEITDPLHHPARERILNYYKTKLSALGDGPNTPLYASEEPGNQTHPLMQAESRIWRQVLNIERSAVIELRKKFQISDDIMNEILRELDFMEHRL